MDENTNTDAGTDPVVETPVTPEETPAESEAPMAPDSSEGSGSVA